MPVALTVFDPKTRIGSQEPFNSQAGVLLLFGVILVTLFRIDLTLRVREEVKKSDWFAVIGD